MFEVDVKNMTEEEQDQLRFGVLICEGIMSKGALT